MDAPTVREARIIYQNALAHATNIVLHNNKDKEVHVEDVIAIAKQIAKEVLRIGSKG